jgi:hypothetical protein
VRGNPHAAFDVAGAGNVAWSRCVTLADERARQQGTQTSTYTGAPVLDLPVRPMALKSLIYCGLFWATSGPAPGFLLPRPVFWGDK